MNLLSFNPENIIASLTEISNNDDNCSVVGGLSLPEVDKIKEVIVLIKSLIFPELFGASENRDQNSAIHLNKLYILLNKQIFTALQFAETMDSPKEMARTFTVAFLNRLPHIKRLLRTDIQSVHDNDPASTGLNEVILCYPATRAMLHYRTAHELLLLGIPLLPRIITELAHSITGIDIHPAARIGEYFSIDHGTGIVIGETCIIGNHVRLYQGVTLGAKGFVYDENGFPLNVPRHPIIEDNVVIYSNSTILGRITIGHDSIIGGNVWQVYSVPPHSRIVQQRATTSSFSNGGGI
ncbi:MAG: serine acetyltransferase [Bacteroidales bacterium]|jgi:serine O-acetyltransferase|nr:serine acetyltransferase [Bacteroidales bacterium]